MTEANLNIPGIGLVPVGRSQELQPLESFDLPGLGICRAGEAGVTALVKTRDGRVILLVRGSETLAYLPSARSEERRVGKEC